MFAGIWLFGKGAPVNGLYSCVPVAHTPFAKAEHRAEKSPLLIAMEGSERFAVRGNWFLTPR